MLNAPGPSRSIKAIAQSRIRSPLLGASHVPPYSSQQPQLAVVERVTIAFLDHYLKRTPGSLQRLLSAGNVPRVATLNADP